MLGLATLQHLNRPTVFIEIGVQRPPNLKKKNKQILLEFVTQRPPNSKEKKKERAFTRIECRQSEEDDYHIRSVCKRITPETFHLQCVIVPVRCLIVPVST